MAAEPSQRPCKKRWQCDRMTAHNQRKAFEIECRKLAPPNMTAEDFQFLMDATHYQVQNLGIRLSQYNEKQRYTYWCPAGNYATEYPPVAFEQVSGEIMTPLQHTLFQEYAKQQSTSAL